MATTDETEVVVFMPVCGVNLLRRRKIGEDLRDTLRACSLKALSFCERKQSSNGTPLADRTYKYLKSCYNHARYRAHHFLKLVMEALANNVPHNL